MNWWQQPFVQVALPIIVTFAIATLYQGKRIDDLRDSMNKRFDAVERRLERIESLLTDHDRRASSTSRPAIERTKSVSPSRISPVSTYTPRTRSGPSARRASANATLESTPPLTKKKTLRRPTQSRISCSIRGTRCRGSQSFSQPHTRNTKLDRYSWPRAVWTTSG